MSLQVLKYPVMLCKILITQSLLMLLLHTMLCMCAIVHSLIIIDTGQLNVDDHLKAVSDATREARDKWYYLAIELDITEGTRKVRTG